MSRTNGRPNINMSEAKMTRYWSASCSWAIYKSHNAAALIIGPATDGNACVLLFGGSPSGLRYRIVPWSALRPWILSIPGQWAIHQPTRRPAMITSDPDSLGLVTCLIFGRSGIYTKKVNVSLLRLRTMNEPLNAPSPPVL